jgi:hypothetical protein
MNTWQLAEDFRAATAAAFAEDDDFAADHFLHGQTGGEFEVPCSVFNVTEKPLTATGKATVFTLTVTVHSASAVSEAVPAPETVHAARVAAVRDKLFGSGAAALLSALNDLDRWDIKGWSAAEENPGVDGMRFETPVILTGTVLEL